MEAKRLLTLTKKVNNNPAAVKKPVNNVTTMPIISISMDEETLEELDRLERSMAFAGRSEAVRAGVRTLIAENKATEKLSGRS